MASEGYPDEYRTGLEIFGINDAEATGCTVYQAGTRLKDGRLVTAGGRVLAVTATAPTVEHAARRAYIGVQRINFAGAHYRRDIGLPLRAQAKPAGRPAATRKAKRS
jgi:phosphoribosylamine--glycine ligase